MLLIILSDMFFVHVVLYIDVFLYFAQYLFKYIFIKIRVSNDAKKHTFSATFRRVSVKIFIM